jgi:hypothetical protein
LESRARTSKKKLDPDFEHIPDDEVEDGGVRLRTRELTTLQALPCSFLFTSSEQHNRA